MKRSKGSYVAMGAILALTLLGAFWALYYDPGTQAIADMRARLEARRQNLITARELAAQIPRLEDELARVDARIAAITEKLAPPSLTYGEAMAGLKGLADRLGLKFEQIQPLPDENGSSKVVAFMPFDVSLEGKPRSVYDFLTSLEEAPVYVLVPGATLAASGTGLRAQIRILLPVAPNEEVNDAPQAALPR